MPDARLLELEWLSRLERFDTVGFGPFPRNSIETRLAIYLLTRGYANDVSRFLGPTHPKMEARRIEQRASDAREDLIAHILDGQDFHLRLSHAGAVRRSELEDELKANRIKEPMGLVWDGRHFHRDTWIALLDVSPERPLALVYSDLNDVRVFNQRGHAAGDEAIRRYLELVSELSFDRGDAYRLSGGADEVVILLPKLALKAAVGFARTLLAALGREVVHGRTLRAAAGVVVATDPAEAVEVLKKRADGEQLRAKERSRADGGRPSALAWPEGQVEVMPA
jgi:diguanylate cyclase (GGDEF)-like protein